MPNVKKEETIRDWFPRNIKTYMLLRNVSKDYMCQRLGITRACLNNWLRGDNPIDYERIDQIARVLNITPAQLMTPIEAHGKNCTFIGEVGA